MKNLFEIEQLITLPEYPDEYAVVTEEMTFDDFYGKIDGNEHVKSVIQLR